MNFNDFLWIFVFGVIGFAIYPLVRKWLEFTYGTNEHKTEL